MKARQRCPDCKQWLDKNSDDCYCGWKSPYSNQTHEPDHQCIFAISGRRCPLDGSNNFSTHGGGPWYCLDHLRNLQNTKRCLEILDEAEKNFEEMMEDRIDWRVRIIPDEYRIWKSRILNLMHQLKLNKRRC